MVRLSGSDGVGVWRGPLSTGEWLTHIRRGVGKAGAAIHACHPKPCQQRRPWNRRPKGATKEQYRLMLQNALADRFNIKAHFEKRERVVYSLVLGKSGPRFQESPPAGCWQSIIWKLVIDHLEKVPTGN
jgi:hypothetical protein